MSKTLIHCALLSEAQTFINFLKLIQNNNIQNLPIGTKIYEDKDEKILLLVSGIGKEKTIESLEFVYNNYNITKAINIGIAGCSDSSIKIGTLFCTNKLLKEINFASITTVDKPLETDEDLETLLVDMEAKYFLEISKKYCDNYFIFKVVSDHLDIEIPKKSFVISLIQNVYPKIKIYL